MESVRPIPGTMSPRAAVRTPSGPSRTTVPPRTSRTVQPAIVVGFVSGTATSSRAGGAVFAKVARGGLAASPERRVPVVGDAPAAFARGTPAGETDDVLRAPSLLPLDLISGSRRSVSIGVIELKAALFIAQVHPTPRPTSRAAPTRITVRFRSPPGFNNAKTSS